MPRHPPIALKTLDRSHCQCPSARFRRNRRFSLPLARPASARSRRDRRLNQIPCGIWFDVIGTKRPASRDRFEGAVRQTHHMPEIERLQRQIIGLATNEVRTNLLFTMSTRTGGEHHARRKLFLRMTFHRCRIPARHHFFHRRRDNPADRASGGAGRDRTDDILLAKQALSQLSYGP